MHLWSPSSPLLISHRLDPQECRVFTRHPQSPNQSSAIPALWGTRPKFPISELHGPSASAKPPSSLSCLWLPLGCVSHHSLSQEHALDSKSLLHFLWVQDIRGADLKFHWGPWKEGGRKTSVVLTWNYSLKMRQFSLKIFSVFNSNVPIRHLIACMITSTRENVLLQGLDIGVIYPHLENCLRA